MIFNNEYAAQVLTPGRLQELESALAGLTAGDHQFSEQVPAWTHLTERLAAAVADVAEPPAAPAPPAPRPAGPGSRRDRELPPPTHPAPGAAAVAVGPQGVVEQLLLWSQATVAHHVAWGDATAAGQSLDELNGPVIRVTDDSLNQ